MEFPKITPFGTAVVARGVGDAPTELEIKLRQQSQRVRVVPSLMGGAHYLFPFPNSTVAVQVYDQHSIVELEQKSHSPTAAQSKILNPFTTVPEIETETPITNSNNKEEKKLNTTIPHNTRLTESNKLPIDGARDSVLMEESNIFTRLRIFRDSFKYTVICFILPSGQFMKNQLNKIDSFINQAQIILASFPNPSTDQSTADIKTQGCSRVLFVPNNSSLLESVSSIIESLRPEKRALKERYFQKEAEIDATFNVKSGLRGWAKRVGISMDDINVLMNFLGSLEKIASADENMLDSVPINSSSKKSILNFFRSSSTLGEEIEVRTNDNPCFSNDQITQSNQNMSTIALSQNNRFDKNHTDDNGGQTYAYHHNVMMSSPNTNHQYSVQCLENKLDNNDTRHVNNNLSIYKYQSTNNTQLGGSY